MNIAFPYHFDTRGRTGETTDTSHVRQLIELLLFTAPGERVNRPTFGSGLRQLIFAPTSPEIAAATQLMLQGGLQQWLGDVIQVEAVEVASDDATLQIQVRYVLRRTQDRRVEQFTKAIP